jgi:hypothetical protein
MRFRRDIVGLVGLAIVSSGLCICNSNQQRITSPHIRLRALPLLEGQLGAGREQFGDFAPIATGGGDLCHQSGIFDFSPVTVVNRGVEALGPALSAF